MKLLTKYVIIAILLVLTGCSKHSNTTQTTTPNTDTTTPTVENQYAYRNCFLAINKDNNEFYYGKDSNSVQTASVNFLTDSIESYNSGRDDFHLNFKGMQRVPDGYYFTPELDRVFVNTNSCTVSNLDTDKTYIFSDSSYSELNYNKDLYPGSYIYDIGGAKHNSDLTKFIMNTYYYDKTTDTFTSLEQNANYLINLEGNIVIGDNWSEGKIIIYHTDNFSNPEIIPNITNFMSIGYPYMIYTSKANANKLYLFNLDNGLTQEITDDFSNISWIYAAYLSASNEVIYETNNDTMKVYSLDNHNIVRTISNVDLVYGNPHDNSSAVLIGQDRIIWYKSGEEPTTQIVNNKGDLTSKGMPIITSKMAYFPNDNIIIYKDSGLYTPSIDDLKYRKPTISYTMDDDAIYVSFTKSANVISNYMITPQGIETLDWLDNYLN